ncbi:MAG: tetratricopeptide repeat protein [Deltaproteobacteria bacterium]|nr:tetratricopeptide repeat protein [Deltaproteobacteria bacterium]
MKKLGKIKSILLQDHLELLALLNESIGGAAGSSDKENLLPRIYRKWKDALPNLEEAPLFKVLGKKKEDADGGIGKTYSFTDAEKDGWANLFEYMGSDENVRLKFAIDRMGLGLNETSIIFGGSLDNEAWKKFVSSLKKNEKEKSESEENNQVREPIPDTLLPPQRRKFAWLAQNRLVVLIAAIGILAGAVTIWKTYLSPAPIKVASIEGMRYALPDKPSIAVLPFANMSKEPDQEYFIDGLTDDLITDLSKISGVFVIARGSTFTYKGKTVKVKQIAEELGVRYVLEGSVRRAGDEIRINAQLIDALTGHHLWAERYDGTMGKIFALQDQITQKIVTALAVKLAGSEKELVAKKGTDNVAAYDAFLRGWGHYLRLTPEDFTKAAASFKKAIELDPNYGRAYAALSAVYWDASVMPALLKGLGVSWHEARARTIQHLEKATEGPITHSVKSQRYLWRRQHQEAILEMERALALDPNDPVSLYNMGNALIYAGRPKEAVEFLKKGMRLDPHNPSRYLAGLGRSCFSMGELEEAVGLYEKAMRLNPETAPWAWGGCMAAFYALLGRDQEARSMFEAIKKEKFDVPGTYNLRYIMNSSPYKDRAVAERLVEGLRKAGFPPAKIRGGYFPAFEENRLTGDEIKSLLFGSTITGYIFYPQQFWIKFKKNGEITWNGPSIGGGLTIESGKSRIEGDTICLRYQKRFGGVEYCATIFRYPGGSYEGKDEYFWCTDFGFATFSLLR